MFRAEKGRYANDADDVNALLLLQNSWGVPANPVGDYNLRWADGFTLSANSFTAEAKPWSVRQLSDGSLFINQDGRKWDSWSKQSSSQVKRWRRFVMKNSRCWL